MGPFRDKALGSNPTPNLESILLSMDTEDFPRWQSNYLEALKIILFQLNLLRQYDFLKLFSIRMSRLMHLTYHG